MPINNVNVGTAPDNGTGESLRLGGQKINANFAYLKTYIDNLLQGLKWKQRVNVATTANITLSGEQTIDGVLTNASRILVKDQTTATQNGIYTTGSGAWVRALDADEGTELVNATVSVVSGTVNANTNWTCNVESITIGTTDIEWVNFSNISSGVSFEQLQIVIQDLEDELRAGYAGSMQDLMDAINTIELTPGPQGEQGIQGPPGADGLPGADGSDATVTAQAITDALTYTPADDAEVVKSVTANGTTYTPDVNGDIDLGDLATGVTAPHTEASYTWNTGDSKIFTVSDSANVTRVLVNGSKLKKGTGEQWVVLNATQIEIVDGLEDTGSWVNAEGVTSIAPATSIYDPITSATITNPTNTSFDYEII